MPGVCPSGTICGLARPLLGDRGERGAGLVRVHRIETEDLEDVGQPRQEAAAGVEFFRRRFAEQAKLAVLQKGEQEVAMLAAGAVPPRSTRSSRFSTHKTPSMVESSSMTRSQRICHSPRYACRQSGVRQSSASSGGVGSGLACPCRRLTAPGPARHSPAKLTCRRHARRRRPHSPFRSPACGPEEPNSRSRCQAASEAAAIGGLADGLRRLHQRRKVGKRIGRGLWIGDADRDLLQPGLRRRQEAAKALAVSDSRVSAAPSRRSSASDRWRRRSGRQRRVWAASRPAARFVDARERSARGARSPSVQG